MTINSEGLISSPDYCCCYKINKFNWIITIITGLFHAGQMQCYSQVVLQQVMTCLCSRCSNYEWQKHFLARYIW